MEPITIYREVVIVEGPAGSGKTSYIRNLNPVEYRTIEPLTSLPRPRSYDGREGASLTQLKDYQTEICVANPLYDDYHHPRTLVVDRWVLSQIVYGTYRRWREAPEHQDLSVPQLPLRMPKLDPTFVVNQVMEGAVRMTRTIRDFQMRYYGPGTEIRVELFLDLHVLCRTDRDLLRLRKYSNRYYPYEGPIESYLYQAVLASMPRQMEIIEQDKVHLNIQPVSPEINLPDQLPPEAKFHVS